MTGALIAMSLLLVTTASYYNLIVTSEEVPSKVSVLTFRFYYSWILVATGIQVFIVAFDTSPESVWPAYVAYTFVAVLQTQISLAYSDAVPAGVAAWAFAGIAVMWWKDERDIASVAAIFAVLCAYTSGHVLVVKFWRERQQVKQS